MIPARPIEGSPLCLPQRQQRPRREGPGGKAPGPTGKVGGRAARALRASPRQRPPPINHAENAPATPQANSAPHLHPAAMVSTSP